MFIIFIIIAIIILMGGIVAFDSSRSKNSIERFLNSSYGNVHENLEERYERIDEAARLYIHDTKDVPETDLIDDITWDDLGMDELGLINQTIKGYADPDAEIISGLTYSSEEADPEVPEGEGELRVTVIATGIGKKTDEPTAIKTAFMSPDQILNIDPDELVGDNSPFIKAGLSDEDNLDVPAFFRKQAD